MEKQAGKVKEIRVPADPTREARLADALRLNLRRRKAQQRAAPEPEAPPRKPEGEGTPER